MKYEVTGKVGGKRIIKFECQLCRVPIDSPLEEAGQKFPCPSCSREFLTPGIAELKQQRETIQAEAIKRDEQIRAAAAAKRQADAESQQQAAEKARLYAAKQEEKARAVADRKSRPTSFLRIAGIAITTAIVSVSVLYGTVIKPMQRHMADLEDTVNANARAADALAHTANVNARIANDDTAAVARDLASLSHTVSANADSANHNSQELGRHIDSLTDTVNYNAHIANLNNIR